MLANSNFASIQLNAARFQVDFNLYHLLIVRSLNFLNRNVDWTTNRDQCDCGNGNVKYFSLYLIVSMHGGLSHIRNSTGIHHLHRTNKQSNCMHSAVYIYGFYNHHVFSISSTFVGFGFCFCFGFGCCCTSIVIV